MTLSHYDVGRKLANSGLGRPPLTCRMQIVTRVRLGYSSAERLAERIGDITGMVVQRSSEQEIWRG